MSPSEIGPHQIYEEVRASRNDIHGVRTDVAVLTGSVHQIGNRMTDHETRIRALERRMWAIPTATTVIAAVALIVTVIDKLGG